MGTKSNPGQFDCYHNALPNEPMFVLLARDVAAPQTVLQWADTRERAIERREKPESDQTIVAEARECAAAMRKWREENEGAWRNCVASSPNELEKLRAEVLILRGLAATAITLARDLAEAAGVPPEQLATLDRAEAVLAKARDAEASR
jgi:hypothetical protein